MKTNYDDEATRLENNSVSEQETDKSASSNCTPPKCGGRKWKRAAAGAGAGLLIGGISSALIGKINADSTTPDESEDDNQNDSYNPKEDLSNPEWVDDQIQVAASVNDDMSFGEAFATARAETGPGGCFEWHGQLYGTYTAEEWNNMTAAERAEYCDHFSWNHIDRSSSDVAQHSSALNGTASDDNGSVSVADEPEIVSVDESGDHYDLTQDDPEVEILGVVHDNTTGVNIGGMTVDGQDVVLIDVDGDMAFDYATADVNGNGLVDPKEIVDIQNDGITVNDLGGIINSENDMLIDDASDYSSDQVY